MPFFMPFVRGSHDAGARSSAEGAMSEARIARNEINLLKLEIERLLMITESLWSILKEKYGYEDAELMDRIHEIDMRDGRLDGRVAPAGEAPVCPACNRPTARRRPICIYCGAPVEQAPFER